MAKTGTVTVIADVGGKLHSVSKEIKVTIGGCGVLVLCRLNFGCLNELSLANRFSIPCLNALSARLRTKSGRK